MCDTFTSLQDVVIKIASCNKLKIRSHLERFRPCRFYRAMLCTAPTMLSQSKGKYKGNVDSHSAVVKRLRRSGMDHTDVCPSVRLYMYVTRSIACDVHVQTMVRPCTYMVRPTSYKFHGRERTMVTEVLPSMVLVCGTVCRPNCDLKNNHWMFSEND